MNNIMFSILIPAFKATFLKKCINSILSQTYENYEILVVDDASPENIGEIVLSYTDLRIRYYRNEKNSGAVDVVDNWNKCLELAKGDFIICMGDDDMLAPMALNDYVVLIERYPNVDLFHSRVKKIDENDGFIELTDVRPEYESVLSLIWHRMAYRQQYIGDYLFRTSALRNVGGFFKLPYAWASDDISTYLVAKNNGVVHTNSPNFFYRCNRKTITMSGDADVKLKALELTDGWYREFIDAYHPKDETDAMMKVMIEKGLKKYSLRQKNNIIMRDMYKRMFLFKMVFL